MPTGLNFRTPQSRSERQVLPRRLLRLSIASTQIYATLTTEETDGQPSQAIEKEARGIERVLTTSETIRQAASDAGLRLETDVVGAKPRIQTATTITEIRRCLTVQRSKVVDGVATINISFTGTEQQPTLRLVNALAQQAARTQSSVGRSSSASQQAATAAEQATASAAQDLAEARRKRDTFIATHQKILTAPLASQVPAIPPAEAPTEASREAEAALRQRVRQLDSRLEGLQTVRKQLLASMTPEHPHYQLVRDQIVQLQAEIDDANKSLAPAKSPGQASAADSQALATQRQLAQKQQELLEELAILERSVVVKKDRHDTLAREAAEARRLALAQPARELWRVEAAENARRVPRPTSLPSLLVALAIAVVVGSATLLIGGAIRTIDRAADVEELLQVRLLGSLPDAGEVISGRPRVSHLSSRWVLLASEATLAIFLAAMVIVALRNHEFAAQIVSDPLSGLAEGVRRLPAAFGGPVL
ncbi:MAG: hypothetical protein K8T91_17450 [Planctomycetes bacterium]|nr:hypothetical protein [Planctomycetota bacterium]